LRGIRPARPVPRRAWRPGWGPHSTRRDLGGVWGNSKAEPAALTNPIYVDIDDNDFQPNKDTLDHPLPVKFGAGK